MKKTEIVFETGTLPEAIQAYAGQARIYDSSCSETAKTLFLDGEQRAYLKIHAKLDRERLLTTWLHGYGLAPRVLEFASLNGIDYLLTEALEGEDGISAKHLAEPKRLAKVFGESLRQIHGLPKLACPVQKRMAEMLDEADSNAKREYADPEIIPEGIATAHAKLLELAGLAQDDVVLHGDYCLPNIIMQDFRLTGFVDLGYGGVGDRHWDLFWGLWTLNYNLKTDAYSDDFLDAYGRSELDKDRLEMCRLLAGLTG